ncbi:MAG: hypothetical protein L6Q71_08255, partial [Planctomycetes bacterium]|nr:hypothetical protein [Planctomycetota bacterium]
ALAGKEHLKVLRELNEALNRYEELRAKLNKHSRPVFRMLVDQLIAIQEERNPDKARPLLEACRQVARLCDDPVLERDYIYHRSHYAYLAGNARESTRLLRRLVSQILIEGERLGDELDHAGCLWAQNLAASLRLQLQIPEASQIAEASLLFVPAAVRKTPGYHALLMQAALGDIELGRLRRARERLTRLLPDIAEGNYRAFMALPFLALANALSGSAGFEEAKVSCAHDATHILALIAMWNENGAQLDETVTLGGHYRGPATPVFAHTALFVSAVTRARRGERLTTLLGTVDDSLAKFAGHESLEEYRTYVAPVVKTQCALLAGDHKRAMTLFLQANDALRAAPRGISLPVVYAALHHRNAIRLSAGPAGTSGSRRKALKHAREQALKFFRRHIKAGYAVFRSALEETRAPA